MRAVNLIPSEQRSGGTVGARSGGAAFIVLGLLGGLVVLALLYGLSHHELQSRRAEAATLSARAQQVQAQAAQLAPYAAFMSIREQRLQSIAQLIGGSLRLVQRDGRTEPCAPERSLAELAGRDDRLGARQPTATAARRGDAGAVSSATPPGATPIGHARRLRHQPDGGRADARAPAPDRRREQRRAAELHEGRQRRRRLAAAARARATTRSSASRSASNRCRRRPTPSIGGVDLGGAPRVRQAARTSKLLEGRRTMTGRDRLVIMAIVVLAVLAGGWLLLVSPERKQAAQAQTQVESARQQLQSAQSQVASARSGAGELRLGLRVGREPRQGRPAAAGSAVADLRTRTGIQPARDRLQLDHGQLASGDQPRAPPPRRPRRASPDAVHVRLQGQLLRARAPARPDRRLRADHRGQRWRRRGCEHRRRQQRDAHGRPGQRPAADDPGRQPHARKPGPELRLERRERRDAVRDDHRDRVRPAGQPGPDRRRHGRPAPRGRAPPTRPPARPPRARPRAPPSSRGHHDRAAQLAEVRPARPPDAAVLGAARASRSPPPSPTRCSAAARARAPLRAPRWRPRSTAPRVASLSVSQAAERSPTPRSPRRPKAHATSTTAAPTTPSRRSPPPRRRAPEPHSGAPRRAPRPRARLEQRLDLHRAPAGTGSGGGTTPTPTTPTEPAARETAEARSTVYFVDVLYGLAPTTPGQLSQLTPYADLKRLEPLPSASDPRIVFAGVSDTGKGAIFTLAGEAILKGEGACMPSATQCEAVDLGRRQDRGIRVPRSQRADRRLRAEGREHRQAPGLSGGAPRA